MHIHRKIHTFVCMCIYLNILLLFNHSVVSESLRPYRLQQARLPCPSCPRVCSNSCPFSRLCHPNISFLVVPFSCLQSFQASGSFQMSQLFTAGGQSIGVSEFQSFIIFGFLSQSAEKCTVLHGLVSFGFF